MKILGLTKSSFIDYPGKISTVVFTGGCNFKCPYCHNGHIVKGHASQIDEEYILEYLKKRRNYIDAVCISGGEPTLQTDLTEFIRKLKLEGFYIKLDTNGTNPNILKLLLKENLLDYIAMDVKAPLNKYSVITETPVNIKDIQESISILNESGIDHEFRTTVCQELIKPQELIDIAQMLKGSKKFFIQNFKDTETVYGGMNNYSSYDEDELEKIKEQIKDWFDVCAVR
ncbi:anaerobic ribonucleoside-triphosphate reductase activating protein [Alkaliphilus peptidifermentans]|uniref:Pyruvate formate lyase activating enzyme n=1 Tax=Alkaliphilus peptidifermentans DSM 18978 TaxID=1120976 RepID=A0A1G5I2C0_9FIRM|nr:anaerobic ribonucleoside-triphosphate reductase activating protein [Alkaliphilus peptidifermentans]SCY69528.1 pyruvate formate lyase activating enzyme [Alkaliphilus peptidifermentans DSM 18978]